VSDVPSGIREVVLPDKTGFLNPVGDVDSFADGIARLDADRNCLERLSAAARKVVTEAYGVRRQATRYETLYARWPELRRARLRGSKLPYGSRLDQPWIPNPLVRFIRERTRPELRSRLRVAERLGRSGA
jgi:hypothetical protein